MSYRLIDHTSDLGIEVEASGREELFERAAEAFSDVMFGLETIKAVQGTVLKAEADDLAGLLVALLSEMLYQFEVERRLFRRFTVETLTDTSVRVAALGETFDESRHSVREPVKAVTYHRLEVGPRHGRWYARFIVDL